MEAGNPISARLRARKQAISDAWEVRVRAELPALRPLDNQALCDHLPEVIEALALWTEGRMAEARPGLEALADGHAVQRLGYGIDLATLTYEYATLRSVLIRDCLGAAIDDASRTAIAQLNEALDEAILGAVRRYSGGRDEVRDRFIGVLAHDLRNPLNTISMAAGRLLVASDGGDGTQLRTIRMILRSADRMARMIEDVIDLAREHLGGGIPLALVRGDLGEICREAVDELIAGHPGRDLELVTEGDLDGYWDRDRVLQAMSNLVGNALQHGADPVRVFVREAADRQSIETTVTNAGRRPGDAELATMFDPFRGSQTRRGGLGLGLYIVRAIARAHGARCEASAREDGEGFRFTIVWPRTPVEETPLRGTSPEA